MSRDESSGSRRLHDRLAEFESLRFECSIYGRPFVPYDEHASRTLFADHCHIIDECYVQGTRLGHLCLMRAASSDDRDFCTFLLWTDDRSDLPEYVHHEFEHGVDLLHSYVNQFLERGYIYVPDEMIARPRYGKFAGGKAFRGYATSYVVYANVIVSAYVAECGGAGSRFDINRLLQQFSQEGLDWTQEFLSVRSYRIESETDLREVLENLEPSKHQSPQFEAYHFVWVIDEPELVPSNNVLGDLTDSLRLQAMQFQRMWADSELQATSYASGLLSLAHEYKNAIESTGFNSLQEYVKSPDRYREEETRRWVQICLNRMHQALGIGAANNCLAHAYRGKSLRKMWLDEGAFDSFTATSALEYYRTAVREIAASIALSVRSPDHPVLLVELAESESVSSIRDGYLTNLDRPQCDLETLSSLSYPPFKTQGRDGKAISSIIAGLIAEPIRNAARYVVDTSEAMTPWQPWQTGFVAWNVTAGNDDQAIEVIIVNPVVASIDTTNAMNHVKHLAQWLGVGKVEVECVDLGDKHLALVATLMIDPSTIRHSL